MTTFDIPSIIKAAKAKQYADRYEGVPNVPPVINIDEDTRLLALGLPGSESGSFDVPFEKIGEAVGGMAAMLAAIAKNANPTLPEGVVSDADPQSTLVRFTYPHLPVATDEKRQDAEEFISNHPNVKSFHVKVGTSDDDEIAAPEWEFALIVEGSVDEVNRFHRRLFQLI